MHPQASDAHVRAFAVGTGYGAHCAGYGAQGTHEYCLASQSARARRLRRWGAAAQSLRGAGA
jgi:hypothetical protein